nr:IS630 family transposase [uncultured Schaedlerella sp.]
MARTRSYRISLSKKERKIIRHLQRKTTSSDARTRYAVLLAADESIHGARLTNSDIANASGASVPTVIDILKKYYGHGLRAAIAPARNPNSDTARLKATGEVEAKIIATACTAPPEGYARWTVTLLTQESVAILEESLSRATVGRVMQRNEIRPHLNAYWCIPPKEDADFVANMEDILDVYQLPYDSRHPVWCMDEKPYQILGDSREPLPMRPGDTTKIDSEYIRNGTVSVFCFIQPHTGRIVHSVEETRTAVDWAEKIRCLVDEIEPDAEKIILVMDNLNIHSISSLYKAFAPEEARRIARKLEVHYTPKHGSWLDIAEIGINIMTRECLERRIPDIETLRKELKEWNDAYNENPSPVNWQFQTSDSRIKLKKLYPDIEVIRKQREERRKAKASA